MALSNRRRMLAACAACATTVATAAAVRTAWAQQPAKSALIGYLSTSARGTDFAAFIDGMRKLGYTEGVNLRIEYRSADGKPERLPALAAELVALKVDVLVASQTPAQLAAKSVTTQIPILMAGSADPVGMGLVASLSKPGGNITGMAGLTGELGGKMLELIRELKPSITRVALLVNTADPFGPSFQAMLQAGSTTAKLEVVPFKVAGMTQVEAALADIARQRFEAVIVQPSLPRTEVAQLAKSLRLSAVSPFGSFPTEGGLLSYSANLREMHEGVARYLDRILKGAKPGDLPVQQPTLYVLAINLQTAKAIGLTIPKSLLQRADLLIE